MGKRGEKSAGAAIPSCAARPKEERERRAEISVPALCSPRSSNSITFLSLNSIALFCVSHRINWIHRFSFPTLSHPITYFDFTGMLHPATASLLFLFDLESLHPSSLEWVLYCTGTVGRFRFFVGCHPLMKSRPIPIKYFYYMRSQLVSLRFSPPSSVEMV